MKLTLTQEFMEFWRTHLFPPRERQDRMSAENRQSIALFAIAMLWGFLGLAGVVALAAFFANGWLLFLLVLWLIILIILAKFDGWYYRTHGCTWGR